MQRWTALVFLGLVALAALLLVTSRPAPGGASPIALSAPASSSSSSSVLIVAPTTLPAPALPLSLETGNLPTFTEGPAENADAGATLPDGAPVPSLASDAPETVRFGVILVTYRGAQGAPRDAKTREDALTLATQLAKDAKEDFASAAKRGDVGYEDAGAIQRGVLEPGPEHTLFSLKVGEVGAPVDSPRGFYVFKRNE